MEKDLDWNNPITGFVLCEASDCQFNMVTKNGTTSNQPMSGKLKPAVLLNPPNSTVRKIVVGFDEAYWTTGFKFFDEKN